jgi:hypothetical protein
LLPTPWLPLSPPLSSPSVPSSLAAATSCTYVRTSVWPD